MLTSWRWYRCAGKLRAVWKAASCPAWRYAPASSCRWVPGGVCTCDGSSRLVAGIAWRGGKECCGCSPSGTCSTTASCCWSAAASAASRCRTRCACSAACRRCCIVGLQEDALSLVDVQVCLNECVLSEPFLQFRFDRG